MTGDNFITSPQKDHRMPFYVFAGVFALVLFPIGVEAAEPLPGSQPSVVAKFGGADYEQTLAEFRSDLAPGHRTKSLKTLIEFAVRDQHAEEVARLLLEETRSIPIMLIAEFDHEVGILRQVYGNFAAAAAQADSSRAHLDLGLTMDDTRYWQIVTLGLMRLSEPQRKVFEQAAADPQLPATVRIFAKLAVQEAELQTLHARELLMHLELLPKSGASPAAATP